MSARSWQIVKCMVSVFVILIAQITGAAYSIDNVTAEGDMDTPSFWGKEVMDTEGIYKFNHAPGPMSLSADWTVNEMHFIYYCYGEFCFPGKVLTVNRTFKITYNARVSFTGGKVKTPTVQLVSDAINGKWRGVSMTVDGAEIEADAAVEYGAAEWGGDGAKLMVSNGLWKGTFRIGDIRSSHSNNLISVSGSGSRWDVPSDGVCYVGTGSARNLVLVTDGGTFCSAGSVLFGYDRGWGKGGGDMNVFRVDNAVLAATNGMFRTLGSSSNAIEILNGSTARISSVRLGERSHYLDWKRTCGNRFLVSGAGTVTEIDGVLRAGYEHSDENEICVEEGATLCVTNSQESKIYIGSFGVGTGNRMRIASGATVNAHFLQMGNSSKTQAVGNVLEIENGTLNCTFYDPDDLGVLPAFSTVNDPTGKVIIKGTNSVLTARYLSLASTTLLRYEIPDEGLAVIRQTNPVLHAGYVQNGPAKIEVDVATDCPKGKWLLYSWERSHHGESAADIAGRVTVSGGAADRARIVTAENKVYLKVRDMSGFIMVVR